jgi:hypothetical protein
MYFQAPEVCGQDSTWDKRSWYQLQLAMDNKVRDGIGD